MKKLIIGLIVVAIIVIITVIGLRMIFGGNKEEIGIIPTPTVTFPTISDNIIVDLTAKDENRAIVLKIKGLTDDIDSIQYELTYTTGNGLPRGVLGKISVKGEKEIIRDDIVLGTCSSGRCVYDTGVKEINLSLKFNTAAGPKVFQRKYILSS